MSIECRAHAQSMDVTTGTDVTVDSVLNDTLPSNWTSELSYKELFEVNVFEVTIYAILFLVGGCANFFVLYNLYSTNLYQTSRHDFLLLNLVIADSIVCFILIPTEISWRLTGSWVATNYGCKLFQFTRVFAIYLSSSILVCISIDRFYAVSDPFNYNQADSIIRLFVKTAWTSSALMSTPQAIVFEVKPHPDFSEFQQCVMFDSFYPPWLEQVYNIVSLMMSYFLPLTFILVCYSYISYKIFHRNAGKHNQEVSSDGRSCVGHDNPGSTGLKQTRRHHLIQQKILKESALIIIAFLICWTPYVTMTLWYQIDRSTATQLDYTLQSVLFLFAVSNSCVNPFIYGKFYRCENTSQ